MDNNFFPICSGWSPPHGHPVHVASVPPRRSRMERPLGGSEQRCTITAGWEEEKIYIHFEINLHSACDSLGLNPKTAEPLILSETSSGWTFSAPERTGSPESSRGTCWKKRSSACTEPRGTHGLRVTPSTLRCCFFFLCKTLAESKEALLMNYVYHQYWPTGRLEWHGVAKAFRRSRECACSLRRFCGDITGICLCLLHTSAMANELAFFHSFNWVSHRVSSVQTDVSVRHIAKCVLLQCTVRIKLNLVHNLASASES